MQPFRFRLETLLKFRRIQEEQAQVRFAQAAAAYLAATERLGRLERELAGHLDFTREQLGKPVTAGMLKLFQDYHDKLIKDISDQRQTVEAAAAVRRERLVELEEAARNRKLVEKLREKRLAQYQAEALHEEQKLLDELGLQAFARN